MKKSSIILYLFILFSFAAHAQQLTGVVTDEVGSALVGANVYWTVDPSTGTSTDGEGRFAIDLPGEETDRRLVVSYVGHQPDTLNVKFVGELFIQLSSSNDMDVVEVTGERDATYNANTVAKVEVITGKELKRAACCDLSGCFETQASVQPVTTNVVLNSRELRILGLSGAYNQILINGMPLIQGLSYTYGVSSYPGMLIDNIYVAKGANSVIQGFESISGQINVELKDPEEASKVFLNAYANSFGESQFNGYLSWNPKGKWAGVTSVHLVTPARKIDKDEDTFMDVPQTSRQVIYNKLSFGKEEEAGWSSIIGTRYWHENRMGGQTDFERDIYQGSDQVYGQDVSIHQPELYTKSGFRFDDTRKLTLIASGFYQDQDSYFGTTHYEGQQVSLYGNLQFELGWGSAHDLKTGVSLRHLDIDEQVAFLKDTPHRTFAGDYNKNEQIAGVFAENVFRWTRVTLIAGLRMDHHDEFGVFFTPRGVVKYEFTERTNLRVSAGTGFRTANIFSENIGLLTGNRDIVFEEDLEPEEAFNMGTSFTHSFNKGPVSATFEADFYTTRFSNQIFPDYDREPAKAIIANFQEPSVSNSFQVETKIKLWEQLEIKAAYNYLDVYRKYGEVKKVLPFNSKHKVHAALSYQPTNKKWHADLNLHWFGEQRLPETDAYPAELQQPDFSDPYSTLNVQFTKVWDKWEVYAGCENVFDFRQEKPILSWENPFSPYFDPSFNWGPTRGREFYLGVRFEIK